MQVIPAIDLLGGRVVRLSQGDYDQVTHYHDDPLAQARSFVEAGATRLHVVDLDGARDGVAAHAALLKTMVQALPVSIQVGGGVRRMEVAEAWLSAGVARVVIGTAAVREPEWVEALCARYPGQVVIALDAKHGEVMLEGWRVGSGQDLPALAARVDAWGPAALLYTAVQRDGMQSGPDVTGTAALQAAVQAEVIASGGIGALAHLTALAQAGVRAAVCGRALYAGAFTLEQALAQARR
ncbi:MAG: 1-(5-phosphoribosyl)-5-[(5-phosphoribosylamino)methylideneamino]imidazole-4-carboxamide isomerase [Polyangiales bacterium]